jgi:hypothetical protein
MNEMCNVNTQLDKYQRVDVYTNGDLFITSEGTRDNDGWVYLDFCYHTISP